MAIPSSDASTFLQISINPDGSLTHHNSFPSIPPSTSNEFAISKDVTLNAANKTFIRLFRPTNNPPSNTKLPLIVHLHGGGFIICSATSNIFHRSCSIISSQTPALIASVEYRLAPKHRLPAAYEDAVDAIIWIQNQAKGINGRDQWMEELADYSRVFLMGCSAGANIAYNAALRALNLDLSPLKVIGMILNQPYFSGSERTESELRFADNPFLPLAASDMMWNLGLPKGADRDHEFCNPLISVEKNDDKIGRLPRCLIWASHGDLFVDKQKQLADLLKARGVQVVTKFNDGGYHGIHVFEAPMAQLYHDQVKDFVNST